MEHTHSTTTTHHCRYCDRPITLVGDIWVDPDATGDDDIWRETCDAATTFVAHHQPDRMRRPADVPSYLTWDGRRQTVTTTDGVTYRWEFYSLAMRDAGLGVGHIWTATHCAAYRTLNPAQCSCGENVDSTRPLTDIMEFDHVIRVHDDGRITAPRGIWAPELHDGELDSAGWSLLDGFSGQYRYSGPIMHSSEFIGGGMETYIRETPGVYVSLVDYPVCGDDCENCDCYPDGWAVAVLDI